MPIARFSQRLHIILIALLAVVPVPAVSADVAAGGLHELPQLAERGEFDRVRAMLNEEAGVREHPSVVSLLNDLERFARHEAKRDAERREAYDKALAELERYVTAERYEDALISAIEAHNLADDPLALLRDPRVAELVKRTQEAARAAEAEGDWLKVLAIYRSLNLLYDDYATFLVPLRDAERHVRLLRLYTPRTLETLLETRAEERRRQRELDEAQNGDEDQDADGDDADREREREIDLGDETWQQRLDGVRLGMLRQTLTYAASKHVEDQGWGPLLLGALDAMLVMLDTPELAQTFPGLKDPGKLADLRAALVAERKGVERDRESLNLIDATRMIDRITTVNERTTALPEAVLAYEMADGALARLDDFTAVIWPRDMEQFARSFRGKFYGVGIQISKRDGRLIVVSPLADTPAMRAGIKAGDIIASVDGRDTSSWSLDKAVREITGDEGTFVNLGIERVGSEEVVEYKIKRAEIPIESIRGWSHKPDGDWDYYIDPASRIGYVRLSQFIPQSADDLDEAISQMEEDQGLSGLILDLRFNPGGLLNSAVEICDRFLPTGPIVSTVDAAGQRTSELSARREHTRRPIPLIVLINQGSASASEIVAGALQDYKRATIIGDRSFGKGSVQDLFKVDNGRAYLKLTTQYYMLPGRDGRVGRIIHRKPEAREWGIEPDLLVRMTDQQVADAIEARQKVDVLNRPDKPENAVVEPEAGEGGPNGDGAAKVNDDDDDELEIAHPQEILERGFDPQLEAALLVLKTRLVAQNIALAQRENQQPVTVP